MIDYNELIEYANKLKLKSVAKDLENIEELSQNKNCFISFVGQFSSGKSSLINNLLKRDLLPQGRMETTPFLTYIRFGEEEYGEIVNKNGTTIKLELERLKGIKQSDEKLDLDDIEHLEIYLNNELLSKNIILVDTPGINTMIDKHENLLYDTLRISAKIIYVSCGAPTDFDKNKLSMFSKQGIPLSYIRTHCDEINEFEESLESVIEADIKFVSDFNIEKMECFHISNLSRHKSFDNIEKIKEMLRITENNSEKILRNKIKNELIDKITVIYDLAKDRLATLARQYGDNMSCVEKEKEQLIFDIAKLKALKEQYSDDIEKDVIKAYIDAEKESLEIAEGVINKCIGRIITANVVTEEDMLFKVQEESRKALDEIFKGIKSSTSALLETVNGYNNNLDFKTLSVVDTVDIPSIDVVVINEDEQLRYFKDQLRKISDTKKMIDNYLESSVVEKEQLLLQAKNLEKSLIELQAEYKECIDGYEEHYVMVEEGREVSHVFKNIGQLADLALMVLPLPSSFSVEAAKILGTGQKTFKILKEGKNVAEVIKNIKNMSKTYATAKRIKQVNEIINIGRRSANLLRESDNAGFLDYFTVEHWAEKFGKNFDRPPKYSIDYEYEAEYRKAKQKIEQDIKNHNYLKFELKKRNREFDNKIEENKALKEVLRVREEEVNKKLLEYEQQIKIDANKKALLRWKNECSEKFENIMKDVYEKLIAQYFNGLPEKLQAYQFKQVEKLQLELQNKKNQLDKIESMSHDDIKERIEEYDALCNRLGELKKSIMELEYGEFSKQL